IGRTLQGLSSRSSLQAPFRWYGSMFLKITLGISRHQEYTADALAARLEGSRPLSEALKSLAGGDEAFAAFWKNEAAPLLSCGFRPPLLEGFASFLGITAVKEALGRSTKEALERAT